MVGPWVRLGLLADLYAGWVVHITQDDSQEPSSVSCISLRNCFPLLLPLLLTDCHARYIKGRSPLGKESRHISSVVYCGGGSGRRSAL